MSPIKHKSSHTKQNNIKISVIIVTFNNEDDIDRCLCSLIQATQKFSTEIIIIDNNSRDNTLSLVKNHQHEFNSIHIIENKENMGFTRAINQGLNRISSSEYILLLNPDTELPALIFQKLLPKFKRDPSIGAVAPQFFNEDGTIQPSCRRFPRHRDILYHALALNLIFPRSPVFNFWKMGDFDHLDERFVDQPQGAFLLTTYDAFLQVGLFDERFPMFFSDVDWCHRFIDNRWKILFTPDVHIMHIKGASVHQHRIPLIWSSHISFYRYFAKYYKSGLWPVLNFLTGILLILLAFLRTLLSFLKFRYEKKY